MQMIVCKACQKPVHAVIARILHTVEQSNVQKYNDLQFFCSFAMIQDLETRKSLQIAVFTAYEKPVN